MQKGSSLSTKPLRGVVDLREDRRVSSITKKREQVWCVIPNSRRWKYPRCASLDHPFLCNTWKTPQHMKLKILLYLYKSSSGSPILPAIQVRIAQLVEQAVPIRSIFGNLVVGDSNPPVVY